MAIEHLILVFIAFLLGGVMKGAVGAGAPILAVPIMAILVDVPFAVAVFLVPNIVSNGLQIWRYRADFPDRKFTWNFALAGVVGAGIGTYALARLDSDLLISVVAAVVLIYVAFRLWKPSWKLAWPVACRLAAPIGGLGGIFQGAIGMSAPVSVTFTNAIQFDRKPFIAVMALYFFAMTWMQLPAQLLFDIMTTERFLYSLLATIPMVLGMPLGNWLVRHISRQTFDRAILVLLTVLAVRLLIQALG